MDSEDFGGLFWGDIIHLKPLNSPQINILDLRIFKRFDELFTYLVIRPLRCRAMVHDGSQGEIRWLVYFCLKRASAGLV